MTESDPHAWLTRPLTPRPPDPGLIRCIEIDGVRHVVDLRFKDAATIKITYEFDEPHCTIYTRTEDKP